MRLQVVLMLVCFVLGSSVVFGKCDDKFTTYFVRRNAKTLLSLFSCYIDRQMPSNIQLYWIKRFYRATENRNRSLKRSLKRSLEIKCRIARIEVKIKFDFVTGGTRNQNSQSCRTSSFFIHYYVSSVDMSLLSSLLAIFICI